MADTFDYEGQTYTLSDDGQTVTNKQGQKTAIGGLSKKNPLRMAAETAYESTKVEPTEYKKVPGANVEQTPENQYFSLEPTPEKPNYDVKVQAPITQEQIRQAAGLGTSGMGTATPSQPQIQPQPVARPVNPNIQVGPTPAAPPTPAQAQAQVQAQAARKAQAAQADYDPNRIIGIQPGPLIPIGEAQTREVSKKPTDKEQAAYDAWKEANRKVNEVQIENLNAAAEYQKQKAIKEQEYADLQAQQAAQTAKTAAEIETEVQSKRDQYTQIVQQSDAIKPRDFWADMSTFQRIMAGISIGLGAAAQAKGAGSNPGLQIIQSAIQSDLNKQNKQVELAKGRIVNARNAIGLASSLGADKLNRDQAANALALNKVRQQIVAIAANATTAEMQNAAKNLITQTDQLHAQADLEREQGLRSTVESNYRRQIGERGLGTPVYAGQAYEGDYTWKEVQENPKLRAQVIPGTDRVAPSEYDYKAVTDNMIFQKEMKGNSDQLKSYYTSGNKFSPTDRQKALPIFTNMFVRMKGPDFMQAGANLAADEKAMVYDMLGRKPTSMELAAIMEKPMVILHILDKIFANRNRIIMDAHTRQIVGKPQKPGSQPASNAPGIVSEYLSGYKVQPHQ